MEDEISPPPSFSAGRRWGMFLSVVVSLVAVLALVLMVNYLGARYYARTMWSRQADLQLSLRTVALLKSITNEVKVVIYYDKRDKLYESVASMLNEYHLTNPKIAVRTVDYLLNAGEAQQAKLLYKLGSGEEKNVVIFECNGRQKVVPAAELGDFNYRQDPNTKEYEKHLEAFDGERRFSSALINVLSAKTRKAYFLEGHGEHSLASSSNDGYQKFGMLLEENSIVPAAIHLFGTNPIPADCNLLVIAGPRMSIPQDELDKVQQYLKQGGHLFALLNYSTMNKPTGLEAVLAEWNIRVGMDVVTDALNTQSGDALTITNFNPNHPLSKPLRGFSLVMLAPRSVGPVSVGKQGPGAPKVTGLFSTSDGAAVNGTPTGTPVILAVAADKESIQGVFPDHAATAMVVAGDSLLLQNQIIDLADNRDFGTLAINWLLDQRQLMEGIGPHPIMEYKLMMTAGQFSSIAWIFLGAMPGGVLALGGLVWFRRRR